MRHTRIAGLVVVLLIAVTLTALWYQRVVVPRRTLDRLVRGDSTVEIEHMTISGQGLVIDVTDRQLLSYIAASAARARGHDVTPGLSYTADLSLGTSRRISVGIDIPEELDGFGLLYPLDVWDDPNYFWIAFHDPIPEGIRVLLLRLRHPASAMGQGLRIGRSADIR